MLNALVLGAKELAEPRLSSFPNHEGEDFNSLPIVGSSPKNGLRSMLDSRSDLLAEMSRDLTKATLERVRAKASGPLQATSSPTTRISSALQKQREKMSSDPRPDLNPVGFAELATEYFIMPMINRMWIYLQEASSARLDRGGGRPYLGSGWAILLQPMLLSRFIESLTVLVYLGRSSADCLRVYVIESLVLGIRLREHQERSEMKGGEEAVEGSILQLVLIILDLSINYLNHGKEFLLQEVQSSSKSTGLLKLILEWVKEVIEIEKGRRDAQIGLSRNGLAAIGIFVLFEQLDPSYLQ